MLKRKGRRLAALLSALVCMSAGAIPASAKVCDSKTSGNFTAQTGYNGTNIYGTVSNGTSSGSFTAEIDGLFRYANDNTDYEFYAFNSGSGYYRTATYIASKIVDSAEGYGDFVGSANGASFSTTLRFD